MTSCFFCRVSIPMSTNICEADKINFEYIIYFSFNVYNILKNTTTLLNFRKHVPKIQKCGCIF